MPFITKERRKILDKGVWDDPILCKLPGGITPGDRCYSFYKSMVNKWKRNPRWTTADEIYRNIIDHRHNLDSGDNVIHSEIAFEYQVARELAWQVFFQLYVMPYELKKREENGDI
jgi:hypothetical protein